MSEEAKQSRTERKEKKADVKKTEASLDLMLKLDRQRRQWRFFAVIFMVVAGWFVFTTLKGVETSVKSYVAKVNLNGIILNSDYEIAVLDRIAKNSKAKALIVKIDSPGGTMVDGLELYHALRRVAAHKPVVAIIGNMGASAGYLVAIGADHILANEASVTGSVGVFMPLFDVTGLADKVGIKSDDVMSGDLKVVTSPLRSRDEHDRAYLQSMVDRLDDIFMGYVTSRRELSTQTQTLISDGRAITGLDAVELNLIDATGGLINAREWLAKNHNIKQDMGIKSFDMDEKEGVLGHFLSELKLWPMAVQKQHGAMALYQ